MRRLFFFLLLLIALPAASQLRLPRLISDSMILQRDTDLWLWGWAAPGEKVNLQFNQKMFSTVAGPDGKWRLRLPPQKAGGPHHMTFEAGGITKGLQNILFGDVWVCSGQSNMELTMERVRHLYAAVVANTNNSRIRQFEVPDVYNFQNEVQDVPAGHWISATGANLLKFSAVAYFFADELHSSYGIPIGLVNAAVGGSPAEAWMSEAALKTFPHHYRELQKFKSDSLIRQLEAADRQAQQSWFAHLNRTDEGLQKGWAQPAFDDSQWAQMLLPGYWWEGPLGKVNGAVWFRNSFQLTDSQHRQPAELLLGRIVDADSVFVNGRFVGTTSYQYPPRRYRIPAGILTSGKNVIAIKVISQSGQGGFVLDKPYQLQAGTQTIDLKGPWKYKPGAAMPPMPSSTTVRWKPAGLFNAMIAPLTPYAVKGVIWYQGESNTGNPAEYGALMQTLIKDWRSRWQQKEWPFLFVQLANFMEPRQQPAESNWAALRQAQLQTLNVPGTGMAVAIDLGEWNDIHPLNKKDVGHRLALQAKQLAYNQQNIVASGPLLQSVQRQDNKLVLSFSNVGAGLITKGKRDLKHFAIAGNDGKFVWAKAQIQGNKVVVWHQAVNHPAAVRYAWADNPEGANLYNKNGLPASPFEAKVK